MQKLNDFYALQAGKEGEIKYYNLQSDKDSAMGSYLETDNTLIIGDLDKFEDEPMRFERVLQHEQHHRNFAHTKITTQDGKEVLARQAPMSMEQHYKLEQADEVGSKITELMTMRQKYVETYGASEKSKQLARTYLANYTDENAVKLRKALEKGYTITAMEGNKFKIKNGEKEEIADMGDRSCPSVKTYINKKRAFNNLDNEMRNEWVKDEDTGDYWYQVKMGYTKPLSTEPSDMKKDMDYIGVTMAKNWMNQHANNYVAQCKNRTEIYFADHNFQEIKPNNDNYNKALSAALTIGGWDFSESVKGYLSAPEKFQKIDEQIAKDKNEASIIEFAKKQGLSLGKNRETSSNDIEYRIAAKIAGNDKITGVEKEKPELAKWNEEYATLYKNATENLKKMDFKNKEEIEKLRQETGFDNKKPGDPITKEDITKMNALYQAVSKHYSELNDEQKINNLDCMIALDQIKTKYHNDNVSKEEIAQYKKVYDQIKTADDTPDFESVNIATIQRYVTEIKSGIEQGKSAEEFRLPTGYKKEYRDAFLQTSKHNKDFTQPFLTDYYKALQDRAAQQVKERVDNLVHNRQEFAKKEQEKPQQTAQTNTNTNTPQQMVAYAGKSNSR